MKKISLLIVGIMFAWVGAYSQSSCFDWNEYVDYKNTGGTEFFTLEGGMEEMAAQTYHYSGSGFITDIKIEGQIPSSGPGSSAFAYVDVSVYNVDANNRPMTIVASRDIIWYWWETSRTVSFGGNAGGVYVVGNFAVVVKMIPFFSGQQFQIKSTGTNEGGAEDLPSVAGTSTGGNWSTLLPGFDGDLYITPRMKHEITADFDPNKTCGVDVSETVFFNNMSDLTTDPMFNTIMLSGYTGSETLYSWDFGDGNTSTAQNPTHAYSAPGVYTVALTATIDDWPMGGGSCSDTKTMQISVGLEVSGSPTSSSCFGDSGGTITLMGSGGDNSSYMYSIDGVNFQSSPTFTGLTAGTYDVFVMDGLGCIENGVQVILTQPDAIAFNAPNTTLATCGNSDGAISIIATGGTGTLEYSLDGINYQSTGNFNNLAGGTYTVYARDDNNCVVTRPVVVNSTNAPTLTLQSFTNVSCKGGNDGSMELIGSGGQGTLQYSLDGVNFQSSGTFSTVTAGLYTPSVMDAAGCIGTLSCTPSPCTITITEPTEIKFNVAQTPVSCNGGSDGEIDISGVIGGTGNKTYSIDGVNYQSGTNFSGLTAGIYTVYAKDAANCIETRNVNIEEPTPIVVSIDASSDLSCFESSDGTMSVSATGGNGDYSFSLDGINFSSDGEFSSLEAGTYTITVMDKKGCLGSTTHALTQPAEITANVTTGNSTCGNADGTLLAVGAGGSGSGYTYSIDGGSNFNGTGSFSALAAGSYFVIIQDGTGCDEIFAATVTDSDGPSIDSYSSTDVSCNGGSDGTITINTVSGGTGTLMYSVDGGPLQSTGMFTGLDVGVHEASVIDANGCVGSLQVTLTEPPAISVVLNGTNINCWGGNNGSITVSAGGGSGTLAYSLNGVNFQSSPVFNNMSAGIYQVTVRDAAQCENSGMIILTQSPQIVISEGVLNVACYGESTGAIIAVANGGAGTIQYSIDGVNYQSSGTFNDLDAGNYTLYAQDASGCIATEILTVQEPAEIDVNSSISDVSCAGGDDGVIDIEVSGGVAPYQYNWSNFNFSEDIFNLEAGLYFVTVEDANGCQMVETYAVNEPANPITINSTIINATSASATNGAIDIVITGGTPPYSFNWSNGMTTEDITNLAPGSYLVEVTDANGCIHTATYTVEVTLGIEEGTQNPFTIYPNPTIDLLYVEFDKKTTAEKIEIVDLSGKLVYSNTTPEGNKMEIDVSKYEEGLYFINVYINGVVSTKKVVINR